MVTIKSLVKQTHYDRALFQKEKCRWAKTFASDCPKTPLGSLTKLRGVPTRCHVLHTHFDPLVEKTASTQANVTVNLSLNLPKPAEITIDSQRTDKCILA